ncbi:MAG: hypothetical protein ACI91O_001493 [Candidatus Poriferisodalaceae bacterium]|jgi:hypothetical protein
MHPTPEEQLAAIGGFVERAASDPALGAETAATLADASRLLRRLERSWPARMPFLTCDSQFAADLLIDLAPQLPSLAREIEAASSEPVAENEPAAHAINTRLQGLLARAVRELPDDLTGDAGRTRIAQYLRRRLAADPALNRDPIPPTTDSATTSDHNTSGGV